MRYYVMESSFQNILLPNAPKGETAEVVQAPNLERFSDIDYDARSELISDRLKLLMERFMPKYEYVPVVYLDQASEEQKVFWRFRPPIYTDHKATFRNDGIVSHITFPDVNAPIVFTVRSPKGIRSIIVRMAVAESALRRGMFRLRFTKVCD